MFKVGDYVVKVNSGVCFIEEIATRNMMGQDKQYYLLIPCEDKSAKVYVPVDADNDKVRYVMTKDEAKSFIDRIPSISEAVIISDKVREQEYKDAIKSGSPDRLVAILKNISQRNHDRMLQGKKNTTIDERYYKQAVNMLYSELGFALGVSREEIAELVVSQILNL